MPPEEDEDHDIEREERAIYAIVIAAMLPVMIGLAFEGGAIDGGSALSLFLVALAVIGLGAGIRAFFARRLPRAVARFTRR
jgi:hypothetical protein